MQKKLLIFPVIIVLLLFVGCASVFVPESFNDKVVDLDQRHSFSINENLKSEIKKFYGAPYKWGGSTPQGTDCSGMIMTIYKNAAGIELPHNANMILNITQNISSRELAFGDLVFFSNERSGRATHMGFYIKNGFFVHASSSRGVILSKLSDRPYKKQFIGATRVK